MPLKGNRDLLRIFNAIVNQNYYLSDPTALNDPFDCTANQIINIEYKQAYNALYSVIKNTQPNLKHLEIDREIRILKEKKELLKKAANTILKDNLSQAGIYCLSTSLYNTLMWSHYANGHKGVALQFEINQIKTAIADDGTIDKVTYSWDLPRINVFGGDNYDKIKSIVYSKSKRWVYENEYRILVPEVKTRCINWPLMKVRNVYLGCKVDNRNEEIIKSKVSPVHRIFRLIKQEDRYRYERIQI